MAVQDGSDIMISLTGTAVVNASTSQNLDVAVDMIETTTKDSAGAKTYIAGEIGATFGIEGKLDPAATYSVTELLAAIQAKAALSCTYGEGVKTSGGRILTFSALMSGYSETGGQNSEGTWTASLQITGAITEATSTATIP